MAMLDRDSNGDVSLDEIVLMFLELGREKKSVARSMHDVRNAIDVLNKRDHDNRPRCGYFILIALLNQNFDNLRVSFDKMLPFSSKAENTMVKMKRKRLMSDDVGPIMILKDGFPIVHSSISKSLSDAFPMFVGFEACRQR
ncbi:hypothetical protein V1517DRAFT_306971 [Lipomyces orientalis]|uniref:Uncharacterized protein n=1 Tax=Lipomyces orientalis TaxID=1233043 RepID=A0ACC3TQL5_9ASCO